MTDAPNPRVSPAGVPPAVDDAALPELRRGIGVFGLLVVLAGIVLVVLAFVSCSWISFDHGPSYSAADLRAASAVTGFTAGYFHWLGWAMLVITSAWSIAGGFPFQMREASARIGALFGVLSAATTLTVLSDLSGKVGLGDYWKNFSDGPYFALGGFLLIALGGVIAS